MTMEALASNGYSKTLAEPNLVTLSGHSASFISGGQFAVPTAVGVNGVGAVTTNFKSFGTQVTFTPTVIDKDRIRLVVSPSLSTTDQTTTVNGIPGLTTRAVETTVDLRATGAMAGDRGPDPGSAGRQQGPHPRHRRHSLPGHLLRPSAGEARRDGVADPHQPRVDTPLEAEECPLVLPGMEVTEPSDCASYLVVSTTRAVRITISAARSRRSCSTRPPRAVWRPSGCPATKVARNRYFQGPHGFRNEALGRPPAPRRGRPLEKRG